MKSSKSDAAASLTTMALPSTFLLAATLLWIPLLWLAVAPAFSHAQETSKNPLTPKYLIGNDVSLTNKSYPEIEKAIQRFSNRDAAGAQEFLEKAKAKYPKLAPAEVMMAKMLLLARNARGVQIYLERAATKHPEDPEAYLILADLAYNAQRTTESLSLFAYAAPLVEKYSENNKRKRNFTIRVLAGRAAVAERRQQWKQASSLLQKWLDIAPENAVPHTRMGVVLFRLDRAKESLAQFSKAREINPDSPHPFVSLGQLFYANGDNEEARKSFEKAYRENSSDPQIAQSFAEWLIQQGELDKAQKIAVALRKQSPDSIRALLLDGIVAYMQGQSDSAERTLQKVLSLDPRNARATDLMALLLIQSEKVQDQERALSYAENNAGWLPNNAQANVTKAYVLYELGRNAEAQKSLQQAGKMQIRADSTYLIAKILVAEGQKEKAIAALTSVVNRKTGLLIFRQKAAELLSKLQAERSETP